MRSPNCCEIEVLTRMQSLMIAELHKMAFSSDTHPNYCKHSINKKIDGSYMLLTHKITLKFKKRNDDQYRTETKTKNTAKKSIRAMRKVLWLIIISLDSFRVLKS